MNWYPSKYPLIVNPYDSFMKKHLEHYGYFTGRNLAIKRFGFEPKKGYKSNNDSDLSDTESDNSDSNTNNQEQTKAPMKNRLNESFKWWSKENKNLYSLGTRDLDYQREPRWPIEMQVLPERIKHLNIQPKDGEPFYVKTGLEETPMVQIDSRQKTVFYYNPLHCGYFVKSRVGGSREGCKNVRIDIDPSNDVENTLIFESRFESGNLMKAIKVGDYEYDLYLRFDLYTDKHTQWFYFQIKNAKPNQKYRFTICNFLKSDSLYNMGMRPLMYSEHDALNKNIGWRRCGENIKYYKNNIKSEDMNGNTRAFYSLTWTCEFLNNQSDTYYFAHCYPYTYSDCQDYIKEIQDDPIKSKYCKVKVLCRSLAENLIHLLTITNQSQSIEEHKSKRGIVITSRVHPGETNSSWMMKGFLDFLLGNTADAKLLRDNFIFKIIPMLNPDGVVIGNYRCSLTGRDLNRNYKTILKEAFPPVWHTREMIKKFSQERDLVIYCDLHGHSRRQNIFLYGCHNNKDDRRRFKERIFPLILSKNSKDKFSYKYCRFKVQKSKDGTGRIVMWNLGVLNSFTLEATFAGATIGPKAGYHFSTRDFEQMGYEFCDSILDYCDPDQTKCHLLYKQIEQNIKDLVRKRLEFRAPHFAGNSVEQQINLNEIDLNNINLDEITSSEESSDDAGSDSSADDGLPLHLERFAKNMRQRKKRKLKMTKSNNAAKSKEKDKRSASKSNEASNKDADKRPLKLEQPRSAKPLNNGIPIFTHERAEERATHKQTSSNLSSYKNPQSSLALDQNESSLAGQSQEQKSLHTTLAQLNQEEANVSLKYTNHILQLPSSIQSQRYESSTANHSQLCDQHKKKISDFFLFRMEGLQKEKDKNAQHESDGNASDDEAELTLLEENRALRANHKPRATFEEYINKYVLSRFESNKSGQTAQRNNYLSYGSGGSAYNTQTPMSASTKFTQTANKIFNNESQHYPLEIRPLLKDESFHENSFDNKKNTSNMNAPNSTTITTYETLGQSNKKSNGNVTCKPKALSSAHSTSSNKDKYPLNKVNQTYVTSVLSTIDQPLNINNTRIIDTDNNNSLEQLATINNRFRNSNERVPEKFSRPLALRQRTNQK